MKKNSLRIQGKEIEIPPIVISSWLDQSKVEDEFTLTLDIYVPSEEDALLTISFDHLVLEQCQNVEQLKRKDIHIANLERNKYQSHIYIEEEEYEPVWLKFTLYQHPTEWISGKGIITGKDSQQEVTFYFEGVALVSATQIIDYQAEANGHQKRIGMLSLLDTLSSAQAQRQYKQAVPFVHIPFELFSQWKSAYQLEYKWFFKEYNPKEIHQLKQLDELMSKIYQQYELDLADVPQILDDPLWQKLMEEAKSVKEEIENAST